MDRSFSTQYHRHGPNRAKGQQRIGKPEREKGAFLAYLAFRALLFGKPPSGWTSPKDECTYPVFCPQPFTPRKMTNELIDHLDHLRETKDLFGNLAKSFAASEEKLHRVAGT
jgi:hypothetical protein